MTCARSARAGRRHRSQKSFAGAVGPPKWNLWRGMSRCASQRQTSRKDKGPAAGCRKMNALSQSRDKRMRPDGSGRNAAAMRADKNGCLWCCAWRRAASDSRARRFTNARHAFFDDRADGQMRPREVMLDSIDWVTETRVKPSAVSLRKRSRSAPRSLDSETAERASAKVALRMSRRTDSGSTPPRSSRTTSGGKWHAAGPRTSLRTVTWKASSFFARTSPTGPQAPGGYSTLERMCAEDVTRRSPRSRFVTASRAAAVCW
ncbi:hypothetical protein M885DRAFT_545531 [Pelagophyceae sp. CCMP2097]|nr:hypothetical protein M885DRAFT_545531 [Pelagophyceae sp. CCMP2097]